MKGGFILVAFAIAAPAVADIKASKTSASGVFNAPQLAADLRGTPGVPKADQTLPVLFQQRYAEGYLEGAMAATEGQLWCRPLRIKPGELAEIVALELAKLEPSTPAAREVTNVLKSKFPCDGRKP